MVHQPFASRMANLKATTFFEARCVWLHEIWLMCRPLLISCEQITTGLGPSWKRKLTPTHHRAILEQKLHSATQYTHLQGKLKKNTTTHNSVICRSIVPGGANHLFLFTPLPITKYRIRAKALFKSFKLLRRPQLKLISFRTSLLCGIITLQFR